MAKASGFPGFSVHLHSRSGAHFSALMRIFSILFFISFAVVAYSQQMQLKESVVTIPGTKQSFKMKLIPGGAFKMGSPETETGRNANEGSHPVTLDSFWIGIHEVTFDEFFLYQFRTFDNDTAATPGFKADAVVRPSPPYYDFTYGRGKAGGFPATTMTQQNALRYCQWLSDKTGDFYRLPTEAEWELACRCGSTGRWSFGDDVKLVHRYDNVGDVSMWKAVPVFYPRDAKGNHLPEDALKAFPDDGFAFTAPVGTFLPNKLGLHDMYGNVEEWCADQGNTKYDPKVVLDDPLGKDGKSYLSRGGSWMRDAAGSRNALRTKQATFMRNYDIGFRVLCELPAPKSVSLKTGTAESR